MSVVQAQNDRPGLSTHLEPRITAALERAAHKAHYDAVITEIKDKKKPAGGARIR